jgi:drug/metabolite transporter (DMT)-like permease
VSDLAIAILLAVLAGFAYALASVLQQRAAYGEDRELSLRWGLLGRLFRNPVWLVGGGVDVVAYVLEAASLGFGSIIVVQPLLVCGLLWALPLATIGRPERVTLREWIPAIALVAGLATFVSVGSPEGGRTDASILAWALTGAALSVPIILAVIAARGAPPHRRALLLAFAAGCTYGMTAALTKSTVALFDDGVLATFGHWQPYALLAVSAVGLLLNQCAFQAGHLAASLPAMAVTDPVVGCVIGVTLFGEGLGATGALAVGATTVSVVVMLVATISLARSPLVTHEEEEERLALEVEDGVGGA